MGRESYTFVFGGETLLKELKQIWFNNDKLPKTPSLIQKLETSFLCVKSHYKHVLTVLICCFISLVILKIIFFLPIGLHVAPYKFNSNFKQQTYCYKNYLNIPVITEVFDIIGFAEDSVGDYGHSSHIFYGLGFHNKQATVYIFDTNGSNGITYYKPICINQRGDMLYNGTCDANENAEISSIMY